MALDTLALVDATSLTALGESFADDVYGTLSELKEAADIRESERA